MGFFKRGGNKAQTNGGKSGSTQAKRVTAPRTPDEFYGDDELYQAAMALDAGSWSQAAALLDVRGEDGWTDRRLSKAISLEVAADWAQTEQSGRAFAMLGVAQTTEAWEVRGNGLANTVGRDDAITFLQMLKGAKATLEAAASVDSTLAAPHVHMLPVSMGLGEPVEERRKHFDEAHARVPFHAGAVGGASQALSEKWGGDETEYIEFARWVEREAPDGHPARIAFPAAVQEGSLVAGMKAMQKGDKFGPALDGHLAKFEQEAFQSLVRLLDAIPEIAPPSLVDALNEHFYISNPLNRQAPAVNMRLLKAINNRSSKYPWRNRDEFLDRQARTIWFARAVHDFPEATDQQLVAVYLAKHSKKAA